ncbi:MAG: hypothetical protein A2077_04710 [Nitrospirae bacterium GWC2_46_6]|nr:MAG: hypothetical protein A2Z82_02795 [Nitrospirae bacterium GWA2_46_11]OGW21166.1 MAG: hypothetical protein A2077_04710 [Nitrospirae bacterium GWC2_46_6]OGW25732.1 MAG: hypothetical protein A2X55_11530 [Nitrospirae bacterium GWB2_47_37]HAK87982.1 hypothetical protein [Nitrospiraceae bacterium]HCL81294.1 hypothetical protein [Nitrospiraceae bacterium]
MCKDKSVSHLNELGWNVVRLPKENINPLLTLSKSNSYLETLGEISDFVIEDQPKPPEIVQDQSVAEISGLETDKFELGIGLKFLEKFLSLVGVAGLGLEASFKNAESIQFAYQNVLTDFVYPVKIGKYLLSVSPDVSSPFMEHINEEGEAYIITDTLRSNTFGIVAYDEKGVKIDLDISALKQLLSATPHIEVSKDEKKVVSFKGDKFLRFAFKAIGVWVEIRDGKARFKLNKPEGPIAPMKALPSTLISPNEPTPVIFGMNTLIRLK